MQRRTVWDQSTSNGLASMRLSPRLNPMPVCGLGASNGCPAVLRAGTVARFGSAGLGQPAPATFQVNVPANPICGLYAGT